MRAADLPLILGAADADRGIGPRDRERARKAARTDNGRAAAVSITASSRAADLWRACRTGVEGGGDWWQGLRACLNAETTNSLINPLRQCDRNGGSSHIVG